MKKKLECFCHCKQRLLKMFRIMKLTFMFLLIGILQVTASVHAQNGRLNVQVENVSLSDFLWQLQEESSVVFIYQTDDVEDVKFISLKTSNASITEILDEVLDETDLTYTIDEDVVVIKKKEIVPEPHIEEQQERKTIQGKVTDKNGVPLPGVSVVIKGTNTGVATDIDGNYTIGVEGDNLVLIFSFVGMLPQEIAYSGQEVLNIILSADSEQMDEVVVTGYFTRQKNSFTGSATTVRSEDLIKVSSSNLIKTLSIVDPSIVLTENVDMGSNPNNLPEIVIRGTTSINASNEVGVNSPLIVIDGVESNIQALYDLDIYDIESVTVLKDASATALYGEQASNGVILVARKKDTQKAVQIRYTLQGKVDFPDLSGYDLMDAKQKLELERVSGIYESTTGEFDEIYNERLARVNGGINTDWIAKPVRTAFSQNHSVNVSGRGSGMSYIFTGRYGDTKGVMKDDYRKNIDFGVQLSYNHNNKFIVTLRGDYKQTNTQDSRFGDFRNYVLANPYDSPNDKDGNLQTDLSYQLKNPLYEASLSSFNRSKTKSFITSLNFRWNIKDGFFVTTAGNIEGVDYRNDDFTSPNSYSFRAETDPDKRGEYSISSSERFRYYLKGALNFSKNLDDLGSMITINAGGEVRKEEINPYGFSAVGFFNDDLKHPAFASQYPEGERPTGEGIESSAVAAFSALNIIYRGRYFAEGSYRVSGSSKFGKDQKYAPFWSAGLGWNLHKESFLENDWIDALRLRASIGQTGSVNFAPYQAITTYKFRSDLVHKYGYGASPITMGNPDLKWETTKTTNLGLTSTFFDSRLNLNLDVYRRRTVDMIVPISMPLSAGVEQVSNNVGEQKNEGFEVNLSAMILKKADMNWRVNLNLSQNKGEVVKIGNTLRNQNDQNAGNQTSVSPLLMFVEGKSPTMIYTVRSAGIDPANGREIFIKKDGTYTYDYDPADKVAIGDATPKLRGALSTYFTYKRFTIGVNARYSIGGYVYNNSRSSRIEQINPKYNADVRAFTDRWKAPGDVVDYLSVIIDKPDGVLNYNHTSRFVEKENYLAISSITMNYEFPKLSIKRLGLKKLRIGIDVNEPVRFSTIKQERGLLYPYARGFSFNLNATF